MKFSSLFIALNLMICSDVNAQSNIPNVAFGTIERILDFGGMVSKRNVDVWLPPSYSPSKKKYPVVYMHDGQMLFDANLTWNKQEWGVDDNLGLAMSRDELNECIVVGIWNNGNQRRTEYLPQNALNVIKIKGKEFVLSNQKDTLLEVSEFPLTANAYLEFIVKELKPYIDSIYATKSEAASTFIGGSSMGGLISLYAICEYPNIFGGAMCMSTHWPGLFFENQKLNPFPAQMLNYIAAHLPSAQTHKLYFDCGDQTLDYLYLPFQKEIDMVFRKEGYSSEFGNYRSDFFPGENHSEAAWSKRLKPAIQFLMTVK